MAASKIHLDPLRAVFELSPWPTRVRLLGEGVLFDFLQIKLMERLRSNGLLVTKSWTEPGLFPVPRAIFSETLPDRPGRLDSFVLTSPKGTKASVVKKISSKESLISEVTLTLQVPSPRPYEYLAVVEFLCPFFKVPKARGAEILHCFGNNFGNALDFTAQLSLFDEEMQKQAIADLRNVGQGLIFDLGEEILQGNLAKTLQVLEKLRPESPVAITAYLASFLGKLQDVREGRTKSVEYLPSWLQEKYRKASQRYQSLPKALADLSLLDRDLKRRTVPGYSRLSVVIEDLMSHGPLI